jgi:hypothetical protein
MNGKPILYLDQYGQKYFCNKVSDLKNVHYLNGKIRRMYTDTKDGKTIHVGYVVGLLWLKAFIPYQSEVKYD